MDKAFNIFLIIAIMLFFGVGIRSVDRWLDSGRSPDQQMAEVMRQTIEKQLEIIEKQSGRTSDVLIFSLVLSGIFASLVFIFMVLRHREKMAELAQNQRLNQFNEPVRMISNQQYHDTQGELEWTQFNHQWGGLR